MSGIYCITKQKAEGSREYITSHGNGEREQESERQTPNCQLRPAEKGGHTIQPPHSALIQPPPLTCHFPTTLSPRLGSSLRPRISLTLSVPIPMPLSESVPLSMTMTMSMFKRKIIFPRNSKSPLSPTHMRNRRRPPTRSHNIRSHLIRWWSRLGLILRLTPIPRIITNMKRMTRFMSIYPR